MDKKLEARIARLEKLIKEDAELSRLIEAIHNTVNDLIDRINNPERQSKLLDMVIHKEDKAINAIIDFIENDYNFSRGYLLSKRSVIAEEASEVAGALAIYSDWEDKGYFDGDGDFDESVNRLNSRKESIDMGSKYEYHKEYPEAVYKDRVYRWFNDSTIDMSDAELQKFVNLCMRGNLTFQCADEIDIDDPDISMIDHLLMDIASEKNDELINTYTDEIDWDNDYIEKYNKNMNRKLEARIARLEKLARHYYAHESADNDSNLEYISDDIERGLKRELSVNIWDINARPVYNKKYNDNYVEVTIEGNGYDVPNECVGIFKVYKRGYGYRIIDDNKNRHIGSLDGLDEVVSMISDIMTVKGEDFYG